MTSYEVEIAEKKEGDTNLEGMEFQSKLQCLLSTKNLKWLTTASNRPGYALPKHPGK